MRLTGAEYRRCLLRMEKPKKRGHRTRMGKEVRILMPGATVDPSTLKAVDDWSDELGTSRGVVLDKATAHAKATGFPKKLKTCT